MRYEYQEMRSDLVKHGLFTLPHAKIWFDDNETLRSEINAREAISGGTDGSKTPMLYIDKWHWTSSQLFSEVSDTDAPGEPSLDYPDRMFLNKAYAWVMKHEKVTPQQYNRIGKKDLERIDALFVKVAGLVWPLKSPWPFLPSIDASVDSVMMIFRDWWMSHRANAHDVDARQRGSLFYECLIWYLVLSGNVNILGDNDVYPKQIVGFIRKRFPKNFLLL